MTEFQTDLADLQIISSRDSSVIFQQTYFVAVPPGGSARLVSADGDRSSPLSTELPPRTIITGQTATLGDPFDLRGKRLVPVLVRPVHAGGIYRSVTVTVAISGPQAPTAMDNAGDRFFKRVFGNTVVNSDQAEAWTSARSSASRVAAQSTPFEFSDNWFKVNVVTTGLHRVTGSDLQAAGVDLSGLASSDIRLFNGGGRPLPVYNEIARPEFEEIPLLVEDGGDGAFNPSDAIFFFGEAVDRWIYEAGELVLYNNNVYTDHNVYWLAIGGTFGSPPRRMLSVVGTPVGADTTFTDFTARVRSENDNMLLRESDGHIDSYYRWFWSDQTTLEFFAPTPGVMAGDTAQLFVSARTSGSSSSTGYVDLRVNDVPQTSKFCGAFSCTYRTTNLVSGLNRFSFTLEPIQTTPVYTPPYFDFLEIQYRRQLVPDNDRLDATLNAFGGHERLVVTDQFTAAPIILDLADPSQPIAVTGATRSGGQLQFEYERDASVPNRFYIATRNASYTPESILPVTVTDLRAPVNQTDLVIVTPAVFAGRLSEYVDYREAEGHSIRIVEVEDIMDNFGYGLYDPTAIRDFLKFAYETYPSPAPYGVLFVGDATYDFLDALGTGQPNFVPPYIHNLSQTVDRAYSDDNYVYFGSYGILDSDTSFFTPDRGFDMMTARWPVSSVSQINNIIAKIKTYESSATLGFWRDRIALVADDEHGTYPNIPEPIHTAQTDTLQRFYVPEHFEPQKIYMWDYPFVNDRKPAGNDAIVNAFNQGALIVNYVGHGNPDVWAHERVFTRQTDLPRLTNGDKLPLVFAASCAIGFFDDPTRQGMGEDLLAMAGGGAVGVVSATRLVYAQDNALFNREVYDVMFDNDSLSICEAMYLAKVIKQYGSRDYPIPLKNDRAYVYFGDPFLRLGAPRLGVEFTERPDSLAALSRSRVAGRVVDRSGAPVAVDGTVIARVYDSDQPRHYEYEIGSGSYDYTVPGPSIYRGTAALDAGEFSFEFVTPLDIGFGGNSARILVYAVLDTTDAVGLVDSLPVSQQVTSTTDSTGPNIEFAVAGRGEISDGDMVSAEDIIEIRLTDSSGINLATGLGHGITVEIDNDPERTVNLTESFTYDQDDYTTGALQYALDEVGPGEHALKFKAWDNANNSSTSGFTVRVVESTRLAIENLLNYPNPMADMTTFYFDLTQTVSRFNLEIFTLSGRKIKHFDSSGLPVGSHEISWDGRDADGDRIATGVYIYRASAASALDGREVESFGKVVVVN